MYIKYKTLHLKARDLKKSGKPWIRLGVSSKNLENLGYVSVFAPEIKRRGIIEC
jgi:hypothetical protein